MIKLTWPLSANQITTLAIVYHCSPPLLNMIEMLTISPHHFGIIRAPFKIEILYY